MKTLTENQERDYLRPLVSQLYVQLERGFSESESEYDEDFEQPEYGGADNL